MKHGFTSAILLLTVLLQLNVSAQYNRPENRIWALGNTGGLDFSSGEPSTFRSNLTSTSEGSASVCDTAGNLLFYTNGSTIWNRAGNTMPHGINFTGGGNSLTTSTTQGAVIVPVPDTPNKYYIFSLSAVSNCKLYCNKVDITLDGGLGDIDTSFSLYKTRIDSNLTEKMIAIAGCRNNVWLLVRSDTGRFFKAYEITSQGINLNPVISYAGQFPPAYYRQGVMKVSPNRQRIMTCNFRAAGPTDAGLEIFDFDYSTGIVSNALLIDTFSYYGGTFSPDNSKLYAQTTAEMNKGTVYQFDLSHSSPMLTKTPLGPSGQYTDMKLAPDGKIYFGALAGSPGFSNYMYMGRINAPNLAGIACDFQDSVTALRLVNVAGTAGSLTQGLPNEVQVPSASADTAIFTTDTLICSSFTPFKVFAPANAQYFIWQDGSTDSTYTITQHGHYSVKSLNPCPRIDHFIIRGNDFPKGAWHISVNGNTLSTSEIFESYQWFRDGQPIPGATSRTFSVSDNGWHSVKVITGECSDSASYFINNVGLNSPETSNRIRIYPNPATHTIQIHATIQVVASIYSLDGRMLMEHASNSPIDISMLPPGTYLIRLADERKNPLYNDRLIKTSN